MGKTNWSLLGLLFAYQAHGLPALTVATDVWPAFRISQPDGQLQGLDVDILHHLQQASGIELQVRRMPWGRALKQMQTGQADLMIGLAYTAERAQFIDYLQPALLPVLARVLWSACQCAPDPPVQRSAGS